MGVMVKFEMVAKPEDVDNMRLFFERILPDTRKYEGCEGAVLSRNPEQPDNFVLIEYWGSGEQFQGYMNWRTEIGDFEKFGTMLAAEPDMQTFEVVTTA